MPLSRVKKLPHGTTVQVKSSAPPKGSNDEMMTEKGSTPVQPPNPAPAVQEEEKSRPRCVHGPRGKCVHCINIESETFGDKKVDAKQEAEKLIPQTFEAFDAKKERTCDHGPNSKCLNCMYDGITNAKHVAFDGYLKELMSNCKNHPPEARCPNCTLNFEISYKRKTGCNKHRDNASCIQCQPPSLNCKRQEYRHVDYVQFINKDEITDFVKQWVSKGENRVGFLYGYYCEDPDYDEGIRAIVEAIYEPPQTGSWKDFQLLKDHNESGVNMIARSMGMQKLGWIYTSRNTTQYMTPKEIIMAAEFQNKHLVNHACGYKVPKWLNVIMRDYGEEGGGIIPEVFMINDQFGGIVRDGMLEPDQGDGAMIKFKDSKLDVNVPTVMKAGAPTTEVEPEFWLVSIANGASRSNKFAVLKNYYFPVENRTGGQDPMSLKMYFKRFKKDAGSGVWPKECWANFHFLYYLGLLLDWETAYTMGMYVDPESYLGEEVKNTTEILDSMI